MAVWTTWIEQHRIVPIIMYHHIDTIQHDDAPTVSPGVFEKQLAYLNSHGFTVLRYDDLVASIRAGIPQPRRTVVLTFDDGYADNFKYAFPLLQKYNVPATFFIPSDKVGKEGFMTWDQLKIMAKAGMTIGSHTKTHAYLPDLTPEQWRDEIFASKETLEKHLQRPVLDFSYPVGGFNREIKKLVQEAGYTSAVSTNRGYDRYNRDVFELNRVAANNDDNFGAIRWAKFSGYYNLFREPKSPE